MKRFGAVMAALTALLSFAVAPAQAADPALSQEANAAFLAANAAKPGVVTREHDSKPVNDGSDGAQTLVNQNTAPAAPRTTASSRCATWPANSAARSTGPTCCTASCS